MSDNASFSQDRHDTYFGTNISIDKTIKKLKDFILNFRQDSDQMEFEGNQFYISRLEILKLSNGKLLNVDGDHLF